MALGRVCASMFRIRLLKERCTKKLCLEFIHFLKLLTRARTLDVLRRSFWKRYACFLRQKFQGLSKPHPIHVHHKRDHISSLVTPKTVPALSGTIHIEAWGVFIMKRTACLKTT